MGKTMRFGLSRVSWSVSYRFRVIQPSRMQDLSSSSEHSAQEPSVAELMEYERSLKLEDRRLRYACGASYVTPAQIPTWAETIEEYGPKVATVEADEAVEGVEVNPRSECQGVLDARRHYVPR